MNEIHETNTSLHETPIKKERNFFIEIIRFTIIAALIVIPFRMFIAQPFVVNGASMDPTFESGEYLIVDQVSFYFKEPARDSVLIFKYPKDPSKYYIKRVIGLPGERVVIAGSTVTIFNESNPNGFALKEPYVAEEHAKTDTLDVTLKDNEYFVMGDNRSGSSDSRAWGPVEEEFIIGRPFVRLLPVGRFEFFPGDFETLNI